MEKVTIYILSKLSLNYDLKFTNNFYVFKMSKILKYKKGEKKLIFFIIKRDFTYRAY